jgi:hypothetical protein
MLRLILCSLIFTSCSMGVIKSGGDHKYLYDPSVNYNSDELADLSSKVVTTNQKDPQSGKLVNLFQMGQKPIKRIGIVVFETEIQPTRDGLSKFDKIYLSSAGKQIITENFLRLWEQSIKVLGRELDFVSTVKIKKSKSFHQYGSDVEDVIQSKRSILAPDDIFFLGNGKNTTTATVINPRGMRDLSLLLVPAYELMGGPKWSEHQKQFINDVSKELNLDAVIIVMSSVTWTAAHTDKHSGENISEEIRFKLQSSILLPFTNYHERLSNLKIKDQPKTTLCYRSYEAELRVPFTITLPSDLETFDTIESELLNPMFKTYKDLAQMTIMNQIVDLKKTW